MKKHKVCPLCGAPKPKIIRKPGNHIGVPFTQCESCKGFYKNNVLFEYSALPPSVKHSFFVNYAIVIISLFIPALIAGCLLLFCPPARAILYAALSVLLIPIVFLIAVLTRKSIAKSAIALSEKRCSYKGYLEFLSENGFKINAKRIANAVDYIEIDASLELYGALTGFEQFNKHFPIKLASDYRQYVNDELVEQMKQEATKNFGKAAVTINAPPTQNAVAESAETKIENADVSSIEKYINLLIKKYNLKCNDARFQNIKIDVITYLEDNDAPDKDTLKAIVFTNLKEY